EHLLGTKIRVRIYISCDSSIEWLYYSSRKSDNVPICYYCDQDNNLINIPQELKNKFKLVYPICEEYQVAGKIFFGHIENK
ncbi:14085_t:CDS:1, partial [Funneliformis geosporum]